MYSSLVCKFLTNFLLCIWEFDCFLYESQIQMHFGFVFALETKFSLIKLVLFPFLLFFYFRQTVLSAVLKILLMCWYQILNCIHDLILKLLLILRSLRMGSFKSLVRYFWIISNNENFHRANEIYHISKFYDSKLAWPLYIFNSSPF